MISYVLAAIIVLVVVLFAFKADSKPQQKNTTKREPLSGVVSKSDWYMEDMGWVHNKKVMIEGL